MRKWSYVLVAVLGLMATSCLDMIEEVYLNKDGSGEYLLTVDMSELFSDPMMGEMMVNSMKEESGVEALELDSVITIQEMSGGSLPASLTAKEREVLNRAEMRMQMSESKKMGLIKIRFPFNDVAEMTDFQTAFGKISEESEDDPAGGMGGLMGGGLTGNNISLWMLSGRTLTREIPEVNTDALDDMDEETMSMMKMFFADATWQTVYHLPGKVKKCSIEGAEIDGKTVTIEYPFLDLMEEQPDMGGEIKFKKR